MSSCSICKLRPATPALETCQQCRNYIRKVGQQDDGWIIQHFENLRVRARRTAMVAVADGETVKYTDFKELEDMKILGHARNTPKRRPKANVLPLKNIETVLNRKPKADVIPLFITEQQPVRRRA